MKLYLSFDGRIGRRVYLLRFIVPYFIIQLVAGILGSAIYREIAEVIQPFVALVLLWPLLAGSVKRWHDRNRSGWWVLIYLVPIVGWLYAIIQTWILKGTSGNNKYGPDPTRQRPKQRPGQRPGQRPRQRQSRSRP